MIKLILILTFLLAFETTFAWTTPPKESQKQYLSDKNQLKNGGFENGSANWTASGGTFAATTTSAQVFLGARAGSWDASAASQTLTSSTWTSKTDASGNGEASCRIKTAATDYVMQVYDGTNVIESMTVLASNSSEFKLHSLNFAVGATATGYRIRLVSASDAAVMYVDDCYLGYATNLKDVAQATSVGSAYFAGTANCTWTRSSATLGAPGTDADCPGPTVESNPGPGTIQTTDADLPQITINSLPAGIYHVNVCAYIASNSGSPDSAIAINDGTTTSGQTGLGNLVTGYLSTCTTGVFTYTSSGNRTFALYVSSTGGSQININNTNSNNQRMRWVVTRFPLESQIAYTQDQANYGWTSYTPTFNGLGTVASIECQHSRQGQDLHVRCKFAPGTTTAAEARVSLPGSLTMASTSVIPSIQVCGYGSLNDVGAAPLVGSQFTVLCEAASTNFYFGTRNASFAPLSKRNGNDIDAGTDAWSFFAKVPIQGWSPTNVPALLNSVVSPYDGVMKIITAAVETTCSSTPCTITRQSGSTTNGFSSITRASTGDYTANFASGTFSGTPWFCSVYMGGVATGTMSRLDNGEVIGANSFNFVTLNTSHSALDSQFYVMCVGPK